MISKYITENGKFRQIDEFMPGTWINLTAPTQDESLEIARRYNVDLADIRAALDDEESSRVDVNDDYVLILFDRDPAQPGGIYNHPAGGCMDGRCNYHGVFGGDTGAQAFYCQ